MSKKFASLADMIEAQPPAVAAKSSKATKAKASAGTVEQQQLVVHLPVETLKAMRIEAASNNSTVRAVLLGALEKAGYPVPAGQTMDLRRVKG